MIIRLRNSNKKIPEILTFAFRLIEMCRLFGSESLITNLFASTATSQLPVKHENKRMLEKSRLEIVNLKI